jgi:hypothetical protein
MTNLGECLLEHVAKYQASTTVTSGPAFNIASETAPRATPSGYFSPGKPLIFVVSGLRGLWDFQPANRQLTWKPLPYLSRVCWR